MTRRRWVYRRDEETGEIVPIEVTEDWSCTPRSTGDLGKFEYDNMRATDGADISSRTKHRQYMKATGTTMASDFTETWKKAAKERANFYQGDFDKRERREAIERAWHERSKRR